MARKDTDFSIFLFHEGNNTEAHKPFSPRRVKVKGEEGWPFRGRAPPPPPLSAVGAFNGNNMESVEGSTEAAREVNAPLILQVSKGARAYANHT